MTIKTSFVVCLQALLIQCALSQCIGRGPVLAGPYGPYDAYGPGAGFGPYGPGCGIASSGGGFPVTSVSPIAPTGISIFSENAIEGALIVGGEVPFLGAVALEGILPTAGAGAISYGCGNGAVGINAEGPVITGIVGPGPAYGPGTPYGPGIASPGIYGPGLAPAYGPGFTGYGCGCI